ncbi:hypothetical protein [Stenomitos frigidus]|uniref:Uncharacterized protein n=1 Tax=Stenomitos frigidus ULC18 TaxID=2107698 RepID=A0A2T1EB32_9CYAN|nr:hypothetical protein [Stenomitos frigidus]PSB29895.1 hypothetical protein C7B82_10100 [Stenomitos frigidus ULC18]
MPLAGNYISNRAALRSGIDNLFPGFSAFGFFGVAAVNTTAAASFAITDADGNPATLTGTATDPIYYASCSFNLPAGLVADAANRVLKLAPLATTAAGATSASSAVSAATPFAYTAESVRSASVPGTWVASTAAATWQLFSTDGSNAAAGTLAAAAGLVYVDIEIIYLKRKPAIKAFDALRSKSQAYIAAGVAAGSL